MKLKKLLESTPGFENRKFGDKLPTLDSVQKAFQAKNNIKEEDVADQDHKGSTDDLPPQDAGLEEAAPKMKVESWHKELDQATQSILRAERMLKLDQPGTYGKIKKSFLKTIKTLQQLKSDTRRF